MSVPFQLNSTQVVNEWLERIVRRLYPQPYLRTCAERFTVSIVFEMSHQKGSVVVIADGGVSADKTLPIEHHYAPKV